MVVVPKVVVLVEVKVAMVVIEGGCGYDSGEDFL